MIYQILRILFPREGVLTKQQSSIIKITTTNVQNLGSKNQQKIPIIKINYKVDNPHNS
jgi:hypothetical protein